MKTSTAKKSSGKIASKQSQTFTQCELRQILDSLSRTQLKSWLTEERLRAAVRGSTQTSKQFLRQLKQYQQLVKKFLQQSRSLNISTIQTLRTPVPKQKHSHSSTRKRKNATTAS